MMLYDAYLKKISAVIKEVDGFIFLFLCFIFSDSMRVIVTRNMLLIYLILYSNKPIIFYFFVCCLGDIVGDVYSATRIYYIVRGLVIAMDMEHPEGRIFLSDGIYPGNI